jgi:hypothetical protein
VEVCYDDPEKHVVSKPIETTQEFHYFNFASRLEHSIAADILNLYRSSPGDKSIRNAIFFLKKKKFFEMKKFARASDIISSNKEEVLSKDFLPFFLVWKK